jgi:phosphatidylglycerophosphate synthase
MLVGFAGLLWMAGIRASFPPTIWGKLSTVFQVLAALFVLARMGAPLEPLALSLTAVVTAFSGLHYLARGTAWVRLHYRAQRD